MTHRILIAEDEMIVASDLCDTVAEAGFDVEGPHAGVSSAMLAFQKQMPDLAILGVTLNDGTSFQLARTLAAEHVPIIFHASNRSAAEVEARFPDAKLLVKPCPPTEMLEAVCALLMRQPTEA